MRGREQGPTINHDLDHEEEQCPFTISAKTPHERLSKHREYTHSVISGIRRDIVLNARELFARLPKNEVAEIESAASMAMTSAHRASQETVDTKYATNIAALASQVGWDMDSPEVVFLSGNYFEQGLDKRVKQKQRDLQKITTGERKFLENPEIDYAALAMERESAQLTQLQQYHEHVQSILAEYTSHTHEPTMSSVTVLTEEQQAVLKRLPTIGKVVNLQWSVDPQYSSVLQLIKTGQYDKAHEALTRKKEKAA